MLLGTEMCCWPPPDKSGSPEDAAAPNPQTTATLTTSQTVKNAAASAQTGTSTLLSPSGLFRGNWAWVKQADNSPTSAASLQAFVENAVGDIESRRVPQIGGCEGN